MTEYDEPRKGELEEETADQKQRRVQRFLEEEVWPKVPPQELGRQLTQQEEDELLGYDKDGV